MQVYVAGELRAVDESPLVVTLVVSRLAPLMAMVRGIYLGPCPCVYRTAAKLADNDGAS